MDSLVSFLMRCALCIKGSRKTIVPEIAFLLLMPTLMAYGQSNEVKCDQIVVWGAVKSPIVFKTSERVSLNELLTRAGGPTDKAGKTIRVFHSDKCRAPSGAEMKVSEYRLRDVVSRSMGDLWVDPSDTVVVAEADLIYVTGNVLAPESFVLRQSVPVTRAIAMAGGVAKNSEQVIVRIVRNPFDPQTSHAFTLNLKKIREGQAEDLMLKPQDVVDVSDAQGYFPGLTMMPPHLLLPIRDSPLVPSDYRTICKTNYSRNFTNGICGLDK